MRKIFADTWYWVAITKKDDPEQKIALKAKAQLGRVILYTTQEVLIEFFTFFRNDRNLRELAVETFNKLQDNPEVIVLAQSETSFQQGLEHYKSRMDKTYSFTDCISMKTMESESITEVLTSDSDFEQDGYILLCKKSG